MNESFAEFLSTFGHHPGAQTKRVTAYLAVETLRKLHELKQTGLVTGSLDESDSISQLLTLVINESHARRAK